MDATDLAILREMSRDRVLWWGSLDPRLSSREIADRVGEAESTVRARVKAWERTGFLLGQSIMPNPGLFGAWFAGGSLRVDDRRAKARVLEDLALVDGTVLAQDHVGPWIALAYVNEAPAAAERRAKLVARLPGVSDVSACKEFRVPPPKGIEPTPLDWRIIRALTAEPRASLAHIAERVGVSTRTLTRRYGALVEGNAVWSIPLLDFSRYEGAVAARFIIEMAPGGTKAALAKRLAARDDVLFLDRTHGTIPELEEEAFDLLLHAPSAGAVDDIEQELLLLPEVGSVEILFPRRIHLYPTWFTERVAARVLA